MLYNVHKVREKWITTLSKSIKNLIFPLAVIETCFEILKYSEQEKSKGHSNYKSPNSFDYSEVRLLIPQFNFTIKF